MSSMKIGQKVKVKSTGKVGKVLSTNDTVLHVRFDNGDIEKFTEDALSIVLALDTVIRALSGLFKLIKGIFG